MLVKPNRQAMRAAPAGGEEQLDLRAAIQQLGSEDASARRNAARALGDHPEGVDALCARLEEEPALSVRSTIFTSLIRLKSPEVVERLIPFLRSPDAATRNEAIEALQAMPEQIAPHIDALLGDEDSDVRIFTVNILGTLRHPKTPEWLIRVVTEDPHVNVCATAVDYLAEVGDEAAIGPLEAVERRFESVPFMRYAVAAAIRRIRGN